MACIETEHLLQGVDITSPLNFLVYKVAVVTACSHSYLMSSFQGIVQTGPLSQVGLCLLVSDDCIKKMQVAKSWPQCAQKKQQSSRRLPQHEVAQASLS
mmetsp:Transcript_7868/g.29130  ORF Transcript_7868/g.29130 Transcript_7868/m.29130 type:complete len:99 (-) Transcript_7868:340-636(-)